MHACRLGAMAASRIRIKTNQKCGQMITYLKRIASDEFEASSIRQIYEMIYDKLEFLQKQASIYSLVT